jgi:hypothetical protein
MASGPDLDRQKEPFFSGPKKGPKKIGTVAPGGKLTRLRTILVSKTSHLHHIRL